MFSKKNNLEKIIQTSINTVLDKFKNIEPPITFHTFYGAIEIDPYNLAIWYFYKTEDDLRKAAKIGLTNKIRQLTINEMIENGYPQSAFQINYTPIDASKIRFEIDEQIKENTVQKLVNSLGNRYVSITFSSEEDVKNKTDGNYYYYFK
jgi:hypothetical protein